MKFQGISLRDLITPAKAFRETVLNTQDRDQWLKETYKIQEQSHGLSEKPPKGVRINSGFRLLVYQAFSY